MNFCRIACLPSGLRSFRGDIPPSLRPGWYMVMVRARQYLPKWIAVLRMDSAQADGRPVELVLAQPYSWNFFGLKFGVHYLPNPATQVSLDIYSKQKPPGEARIILLGISRLLACVLICLQNIHGLVGALRSASGGPVARLRRAVAVTAMNGQYLPKSYSNWLSWFDDWPPERIEALLASPHRAQRPAIGALIFPGSGQAAAVARTRASLDEQILRPSEIAIAGVGVGCCAGDYVAILQAGEVMARHALLLLADELVRLEFPEIVYADEDRIDARGRRSRPLFKPQPNLTLMCSGLLSRGVWLTRREWLDEAAVAGPWAECARLQAWFGAYEAGRAGATHRIPYLLTHRGEEAEAAPPERLAGVVEGFLARAGFDAVVKATYPLRITWQAGALSAKKVSLIVPSRLRGATQLDCLRQILEKTSYPHFEMLVVVTQPGPLDAEQERAAAGLRADGRFRVKLIGSESFNYSAANNIGAAATDGEFLCLLNDDVAPMNGDWLDRMVAFFADPNCAIVGAKLFYPNLTTQHGGVIMGLAGLVEHANRFLPRGKPGYAFRAELDQELSAVTGACLLVRREVFERVGGLDEEFPTAFNDVDFCLRVREAGHGIVFAASVEMIHHETLTFGQHYSAEKTEQEAADISRLRSRWSDICKTDPFHNPNLSLVGRGEWNLAYPPRKLDEPIG